MIKASRLIRIAVLALVAMASFARADVPVPDSDEDVPAYWEYGAGFGAVRFENYPSSAHVSTLALPFPTFQYRGKILRADDREGAHAYLFKSTNWRLEISGAGSPYLDSSKEDLRKGMPDIPWILALGPQLVYKINDENNIGFGVYGAIATDFQRARSTGHIDVLEWKYRRDDHLGSFIVREPVRLYTMFSLGVKRASANFGANYYEITPDQATPTRPAFEAQEGIFSYEASLFESFKSGRGTIYAGLNGSEYSQSANRDSVLRQVDQTWNFLFGFTYVLGESSKPEVPPEETSGLIQRLREKRLEKKSE